MLYICGDNIFYAMYIQRNHFNAPNGKEYKTTLLCEKYREGKKVKTKTILNLSKLPEDLIMTMENFLKLAISDHTLPLISLKKHETGVKTMSFCPISVKKQIKSGIFQCFLWSAATIFGLYPVTFRHLNCL